MQKTSKHIKLWIKGSIVEPVIALVILVMAIAMAFTILTKLNIVPSLQAKNKANELINNELLIILTEKKLLDSEEEFGGFTLIKTIKQEQSNSLITVELEVVDARQKQIAFSKVVFTERQLMGFKGSNN